MDRFAHRTALLLTLLLLATSALAGPDQEILTSVTHPELLGIMAEEGYAVSLDSDGDILWKLDGYTAFMFISDTQSALQFFVHFQSDSSNLEKVNAWNRSKRYSRSYLDEKNNPVLELDLDLEGGITHARLLDFLKTCKVSFNVWLDEVL